MARDETEAAYFTLLRARDEVSALQRFEEYLADEAARLRRFVEDGTVLERPVDRRLRRRLRHTDGPLTEAIETRLGAIRDARERLPDQLAAAERFVEEAEAEHARLRGR
ncbi:hypothetical protein FTX61_15985 [Nitriliruptoraceae bacterium ZYF776]|nr:hypothetical protein [Profundirhabdus halotolerans]